MFFNTALLRPWNIGFIAVVAIVAVIFWNAATNKFTAFHSNSSTGAPAGASGGLS